MKQLTLGATLFLATALPALARNAIPTDAQSDCTLTSAEFDAWFVSGSAAANGAVAMPDSFTHDFNVPCDFYKWGAQMFLHLSSPSDAAADTYVVNGGNFFNAIDDGTYPPNNFSAFKITRNVAGDPSVFALRTQKTPDIGQAGGGETLISQGNDTVYYGIHVNDMYAAFSDAEAKYPDLFQFDYTADMPQFSSIDNFPLTAEQAASVFIYGLITGIVKADAQLSDAALSMVGDMLGVAPDAPIDAFVEDAESFLGATQKAAAELASSGFVLPTTMELKTSWIVADTAVSGNYVTIQAMVPTFSERTDTQWTLDTVGSDILLTQKTLVLTGMHIVAPVKDNPEMAWMSFEHLANNPMADFIYTGANGSVTVPYNGSGSWNFAPASSSQPTEVVANAEVNDSGNIVPHNKAPKIEPITNALMNPWGLENATANPAPNSTDLMNINDVIALNASILSMLDGSDTRASYFQIGGLWTHGGRMPAGGDLENQVGGLYLANSTMETFHQWGAPASAGTNCFDCHNIGAPTTTPGTGISHAFDGIVYRIQNPN